MNWRSEISALARPAALFAYGDPDVFALAAAYAYGIVRNHPFRDGNKRTAFVAAYLFLRLHGWRIAALQADVVAKTLSLAAGELNEDAFTAWRRSGSQPS